MVSSAFPGYSAATGDPAAGAGIRVSRAAGERHDGLNVGREMRTPKKISLQRPGSGTVDCRRRLELSRRM
jgi:hypothetical protein